MLSTLPSIVLLSLFSSSQRMSFSVAMPMPETAEMNICGIPSGSVGSISVSYTHLDVYKRQIQLFACHFPHFLVCFVGDNFFGFFYAAQYLHVLFACLLYTSRCV